MIRSKYLLPFFALFLASQVWAQEVGQNAGKILSSSLGRYVFGQVSPFRADQFMLDTQTGRLWEITCAPIPGASTPAADLGSQCENGIKVLETIPYDRGPAGISQTP